MGFTAHQHKKGYIAPMGKENNEDMADKANAKRSDLFQQIATILS